MATLARSWAGPANAVRASRPGRGLEGVAVGLGLGLLALGPGLRRGFLLSYDMVFVPREPFSAAWPGQAPPRAVPSDLVIAVLSRAVPADIVQKIVLLSVFVLACSGAAALLDREPLAGPARGRGVLRVEPVRRRAAHHRPVGAAARLRRPALGAAGRARPRPGVAARSGTAGAGAGARRHRRVRRHGHHGARRGARGAARRAAPGAPRWRWPPWPRAACPGSSRRCCTRCTSTRRASRPSRRGQTRRSAAWAAC